MIAAAGFTEPAVTICREALAQRVVALIELREIVMLLEREGDLLAWLRSKVDAAITHKNPLHFPES